MDGWEKVAALIVPLLMNWWEVRGLRREVKETREKQNARMASLETRVSFLEATSGVVR